MCKRSPSDQTPGYHGCYLRVDLNREEVTRVPIGEEVLRETLGGVGLGTWILLAEGAAESDPLSPEAVLVFVFSPLVGSPITTSAKFAVVSKSPLTHRLNDSLASSSFALAGKRCGCDALVLTGRAARRSLLLLDEGNLSIRPADHLWGMSTTETGQRLETELGPDWKTAVIGPAGENLVSYATLSHDGRHAGRGGSGAVLGSKQLKAVAVRGSQRCHWAEPEQLNAYAKELSSRSFGPATAKYRELGTASNLLTFNRLGTLPTRNFQSGSFSGAEQIAPESLQHTRSKTRTSCAACTIGCEHLYALQPQKTTATTDSNTEPSPAKTRLEYENLFALGPLCGIDNPDIVLAASHRCDELGLDTISTGGTIAFAMEAVQRKILDEPWLRFGNGEALLRAISLIAARDGLGDQLAEGSRRFAEQLGQNSIDFAPQVKGLEIPGYEPRALQSMALGFAVGSRGADHNRSGAYEVDFSDRVNRRHLLPEEVHHAIDTENRAAILDSMILCKFLRGVISDFYGEAASMLAMITGWSMSADELQTTARRIVERKKEFNLRAGWTPAEDRLPARFLQDALPNDPESSLSEEHLAALIEAYHLARGWSAEGYPPAFTESPGTPSPHSCD